MVVLTISIVKLIHNTCLGRYFVCTFISRNNNVLSLAHILFVSIVHIHNSSHELGNIYIHVYVHVGNNDDYASGVCKLIFIIHINFYVFFYDPLFYRQFNSRLSC